MIRKSVLLGLDTPSLATAMTVLANDKKFDVLMPMSATGLFAAPLRRRPIWPF